MQDIRIDRSGRADAQATIRALPRLTLFAGARNLTRSHRVEQTGLSDKATTTATTRGRSFRSGASFRM